MIGLNKFSGSILTHLNKVFATPSTPTQLVENKLGSPSSVTALVKFQELSYFWKF